MEYRLQYENTEAENTALYANQLNQICEKKSGNKRLRTSLANVGNCHKITREQLYVYYIVMVEMANWIHRRWKAYISIMQTSHSHE